MVLSDTETDGLLAHVEIDLGTMSHTRLRTKLGQYLLYTEREAWRERFSFQPALLFITTGRQRAATFRRTAHSLAASKRWAARRRMGVGRLDGRPQPGAHVAGARWADLRDDDPLTFPQALRRAREPYDRRQAIQRAAEEKREAERIRLLRDPEALREHINEQHSLRSALETRLDETGQVALALLLDSKESINGDEYEALLSIGQQIAGHLPADHWTRDFHDVDPNILAGLAGSYRSRQRAEVDNLMVRLGDLPLLRRTMQSLDGGALLIPHDAAALESDVNRQWATKDEQLTLRDRYLASKRSPPECRKPRICRAFFPMRRRGLEPPRDYVPQGPQPCASTNSATGAWGGAV